jgi:hypothetical protein
MNKDSYAKYEKYFWWGFILLPLVVGLVRYNWLSVEPYVGKPNQSIASSSGSTSPTYETTAAPVLRKLKGQDEATNKEDFIHDRYLEVLRYSVISFVYGLFGCVFYAYGQVIKGKTKNFISAFGKSLIIAFLSSIFFVICTL